MCWCRWSFTTRRKEEAQLNRMLLVEDDEFACSALRELFEENGWQVVVAENGIEAMRHMTQISFEVIATDVFMPEMDGVELVRQIRLTDKTQKILAISGGGAGMGSDKAVDIIEAIGADAALQKPLRNEELLLAVDRLTAALEKSASARHNGAPR